ncbi:hypothetical protein [Sphingomonas xinjiangensis]|uniref:Uncharacterized protein n=1 Tax=Sphingomonas xinjiangensis TaxID=643568 RepID=A0A840Y944_9SPHN|nr:hypothetical protein [Sphingomonas xinjiangensis]MBB5709364.1 hypothetical protein [Sphingomonas xinjiangensis]
MTSGQPFRTVRQEAPQRQANGHSVDALIAANVHRLAQDLHRELDNDSLVLVHPAMERIRNNIASDSTWHAAASALATTMKRSMST